MCMNPFLLYVILCITLMEQKQIKKKKVTVPFPLSFFLVFLALVKAMQGDEKHSVCHELSLFACMHTQAGLP